MGGNMKDFFVYFIIFGSAWILQAILGFIQVKNFSKELVNLRKEGKVVIGRAKGGFYAGTVIVLVVGENEKIINGKKMQGVTVFSRMKEYSLFNNMTLNELNKKRETLKIDRGLKKALDSLYSGG
jgi:Glucitol operon activator